ncbi:S8 family peptidase [Clostridium cavendishii]|uniref:S8 family peptidase n=1 Tax=Clostridium cavendishii TaxID=349931 RepID=UPI0013563186|nr:S8 family peptidase [Clostridium cavendishii]
MNQLTEEEFRLASENYINPEFINIVVEYEGEIIKKIRNISDITGFIFDENYVIISVPKAKFPEIINSLSQIVYTDPGGLYTLANLAPVEAVQAKDFHKNEYLPLTGKGVLIGILDTGIDYLNKEFIDDDGSTRIKYIWDQNIQGSKKPKGFVYGTEYSKEDINRAILEKDNGGDPYKIVPSIDEIGHGTSMASLAGANGRNPSLVGAAPDSEFVIVKLWPASEFVLDYFGAYNKGNVAYDTIDVLLAIKYLFEKGQQLKKPIVILIPIGTNVGSHTGATIIEKYIDKISRIRGTVVVTTAGNQADSDNHTTGIIENTGDYAILELKAGVGQKVLYFDIWANRPDKIALSIISPSGEIIDKIPAKLNQSTDIKFLYEGTKMSVKFFLPEEVTGDEKITIRATDVRDGIWQFKLIGELIVNGRYDAWLNQEKILASDTKFLNANSYTTVVIPGTSDKVITVGYYNQNNNSIVGESGRGYTRDGRVKPDIVAGGIQALVAKSGGGIGVLSGASVAGAITAGCCALLFQWGIIDRNDPNLYATKIKTYLIRGTKKRSGDIYPNPRWGYGALDMEVVFENIRSILNLTSPLQEEPAARSLELGCIEYYKNGLFIRIPNQKYIDF